MVWPRVLYHIRIKYVSYFSRYNRQSGYFFLSCLITLLQGRILLGLFSAVIQWNLLITAQQWASLLVLCCNCCHHHCCYCCCCRQVSFHTDWSSADWSVTVSSQTLLDSSQDPLNTIWCLSETLPRYPPDALMVTSPLPPHITLLDMGRFLAHTLSKPLPHNLIAFQFSLVFISLNHYYHLATGVLFLSWLLICHTLREFFPTLNFATNCLPVSFYFPLTSFFFMFVLRSSTTIFFVDHDYS